MTDKDVYEMVKILMEIPKERYLKFKKRLSEEEFEEESINFLSCLFALIEKHRPELAEGGESI